MDEILNRIREIMPTESTQIENSFDFFKLNSFLQFLKDKNEIGGFFSKTDIQFVLDRHLIESLVHVYKISRKHLITSQTKIADVGTGPGLPGFLFYCLNPLPKVTLIDSQKRKLKHLEEFCLQKKYSPSPDFVFNRMEEIKTEFDLVVMRSAIPYPWSMEMVSMLVKREGYFVPFLGKLFENLEKENSFLSRFGFTLEETEKIPELEFLGNRHVKYLKKTSKVGNSPREWSQIQKEIRRENG